MSVCISILNSAATLQGATCLSLPNLDMRSTDSGRDKIHIKNALFAVWIPEGACKLRGLIEGLNSEEPGVRRQPR